MRQRIALAGLVLAAILMTTVAAQAAPPAAKGKGKGKGKPARPGPPPPLPPTPVKWEKGKTTVLFLKSPWLSSTSIIGEIGIGFGKCVWVPISPTCVSVYDIIDKISVMLGITAKEKKGR